MYAYDHYFQVEKIDEKQKTQDRGVMVAFQQISCACDLGKSVKHSYQLDENPPKFLFF
jgi:hypothetical protein